MGDYAAGERALAQAPRTTEAETAEAVVAALRRRVGPPAALCGMVVLIASEATLLSAGIASYFYLRFNNVAWPPRGTPRPEVVIPIVLVACLATTSVPMRLAHKAARAGRLAAARLAIGVALLVQTGYFAYEVHDFGQQLAQVPMTRNAYTSIYYFLLGADHGHVFLGMLFNVWLLWRLRRGLTTYRANAVQAVSWYWHFVNLFTLMIIGTLLSAAV